MFSVFKINTKFFVKILFLFFYCAVTLSAHAKEIAISFDDAPRGSTKLLTGKERTELLIKNLKNASVPQATFFCNTIRFDEEGENRIQRYVDAGHLIANHSHSHPSLNNLDSESYWADVLKADTILAKFSNFRKWFRFPFLHEGKTIDKRDAIREKLKYAGYSNGYVTVDDYDWYINDLVQKKIARGFQIDFEKLKIAYVNILIEGIEFFDDLAIRTMKRSPKHILLLHENDLAALYIGDLVAKLREKGWIIISPDDAYKDPIAQIEPDTFELNQGRIAAIARSNGYMGEITSKWEDGSTIEKYFDEMKVFNKVQIFKATNE